MTTPGTSPKQVAWDGMRFPVPSTMRDESVLAYSDGQRSLTVVTDALTGDLATTVDAQLQACRESLPGSTIVARATQSVAGVSAVVVETRVPSARGVHVQLQAFIPHHARVVIVTVTVAQAALAQGRALFGDVLAGFTLPA
jgi:hypothetical protein